MGHTWVMTIAPELVRGYFQLVALDHNVLDATDKLLLGLESFQPENKNRKYKKCGIIWKNRQ